MGYYDSQLITYLGNKRKLISYIEDIIHDIAQKENKNLIMADLFSGSGVVARIMKKYASRVIANDLETYSRIVNECYLTNKKDFPLTDYNNYKEALNYYLNNNKVEGIISKYYAPKDDENIQKGERVFYTRENALIIDTARTFIDTLPIDMQKFFLAPLIYEASVHTNTSGVFKGFYKDTATGIGKFGGDGENALKRIKGKIEIPKPVFSTNDCEIEIYQEDTNELVKKLNKIDIAYIDPPYNQHPYGSNYFMLNIIAENKLNIENISQVSGIPKDWNRSDYNKKEKALVAFEDMISNLHTKYAIISYNSEGFISLEEMTSMLSKYGSVTIKEITYNTFRGSRNLKNRSIYVDEYLFLLTKKATA